MIVPSWTVLILVNVRPFDPNLTCQYTAQRGKWFVLWKEWIGQLQEGIRADQGDPLKGWAFLGKKHSMSMETLAGRIMMAQRMRHLFQQYLQHTLSGQAVNRKREYIGILPFKCRSLDAGERDQILAFALGNEPADLTDGAAYSGSRAVLVGGSVPAASSL